MKCMSALALGLLTLNAMALPVLREPISGESINILKDHQDPNQLHFMPDEAPMQLMGNEKPFFTIFDYGGNSLYGIQAGFETNNSSNLESKINQLLTEGKKVSMVATMSSYVVQDDSNGIFQMYDVQAPSAMLGTPFTLDTVIFRKGLRSLVTQLKLTNQKVNFGKYCYSVSGVTPVMNGTVKINYSKVMQELKAKFNDRPLTRKEIKDGVETLIKSATILLEINGGDATLGDYAYAISEKLITYYFMPTSDKRFTILNSRVEFKNISEKIQRRDLVEKEYCLDLDVSELRKFPELIQY